MLPKIPNELYELPIYRKALEISMLSQSISCSLCYDLAELKHDGSEDEHIYFSGDIIQQSVSLAPEILKAELHRGKDTKYRYTESINRITNLLYKNSYRLEKSQSKGKVYLPLLRKELKKFRLLQRNWMLSL